LGPLGAKEIVKAKFKRLQHLRVGRSHST
jgi:hypothetical protein